MALTFDRLQPRRFNPVQVLLMGLLVGDCIINPVAEAMRKADIIDGEMSTRTLEHNVVRSGYPVADLFRYGLEIVRAAEFLRTKTARHLTGTFGDVTRSGRCDENARYAERL